MLGKIVDKLFPCQKAISDALSSNRNANDRLRAACGEGYVTAGGFVPKAHFTEEHLNDKRRKA
jgi:hypothetical protein